MNTFTQQVFDNSESNLEKSLKSILSGRKINKIANESLIKLVFSSEKFIISSIVGANDYVVSYDSEHYLKMYIDISDKNYNFIDINGDIFQIDEEFRSMFQKEKKKIYDERKEKYLKSVGL